MRDGQPLTFSKYAFDQPITILETGIDLHPEIPDIDRRELVWGAVAKAAVQPSFDEQTLLASVQRAEREYLQRPIQPFVLASSLWIRPFVDLRSARVGDTTVRFGSTLPPRFDRRPVERHIAWNTVEQPTTAIASARIAVEARSHSAAFDIALTRLDLLRALWNLRLNRRWLWRMSGGEVRPVNPVLLGPVHTLHLPSGRLATKDYRYESDRLRTHWIADLESEWERLRKWTRVVSRRLARIGYRSAIEHLLVRYTRAFDVVEHDVAFSRLWAVLEQCARSGSDHGMLIDRVSYLYSEPHRSFARLLLEHLRHVRNGVVHYDRSQGGLEVYLWQLKSFVEDMLAYHLGEGPHFECLADAANQLELRRQRDTLARELGKVKSALRRPEGRPTKGKEPSGHEAHSRRH